ncbi:beta-N-acetylhexosaminidase [Cellulomonas chitinilytica]|uniref:beta-N-acetylhexosaminidase n=1 Tax=Cellulomonas chitinilytica TaxID=398759 RepID=A0A919P1E2_9CELL|nr:beta-N-acetylhexosaminidase [Cellulomonas chitinilytica]GIG21596.1 beta-N-acetylhexosaminidase [Cellulomonas chitinilytica]
MTDPQHSLALVPQPAHVTATGGTVAVDPLRVRTAHDPAMHPEGYRLDVTPDAVTLTSGGPAGAAYGRLALRTLDELPLGTITDAPRFAWRGVMLDTARHFMPKEFVLRLVDLLAAHRLNVLQLHLTDDQGWRLPISRYPRLTEVSGEHYTHDDVREIVAHAADRHVTVVPEINVPGHVQAALAAYPALGNAPGTPVEVWREWGISRHTLNLEDATLAFFRDVLDEVMDLFPGPYVHLGGDECLPDEWAASPRARQRMDELGLAGPADACAWFTGRLAEHVEGRGRRAVFWYEKPGGPPGAVAMPWLDEDSGLAAAQAGHDVVLAPHTRTYLDYPTHPQDGPFGPDRVLPLADAYAFDPPSAPGVLGVQAQLWTEHLATPADVERAAFPRLCAFAEVAWGTAGPYDDFLARLPTHLARLGLGTR